MIQKTEKQPDKSIGPNAEQMDEVYSSPNNLNQVKSFEKIIEQRIKPAELQGNLFGKSENQIQEKEEPIIETKIDGPATIPITPNTNNFSLREQILGKLKENDANGGLDLDKLIMDLTAPVDEINKLIMEFLEEGIAYEPKPGRIQLL